MEVTTSPGHRLRNLMTDGPVLAPVLWDAGQARFAVEAGHHAVYMTGLGTASTFGLPDIGLIGLEEMVSNVRRIASAVEVPIIADADTGYGNAVNVAHTVEQYEAAGVAALHIEDQVSPKRCGGMAGKEVIPTEEMAQKVRVAVSARRDPGLVIIARTDAISPLGWDAAIERCKTYRDCGADMVLIDGVKSSADVERAAEQLPNIPRMLITRFYRADAAKALGYDIVVSWGTLLTIYAAMRDAFQELAETGLVDLERCSISSTDAIQQTMGVARHLAAELQATNP